VTSPVHDLFFMILLAFALGLCSAYERKHLAFKRKKCTKTNCNITHCSESLNVTGIQHFFLQHLKAPLPLATISSYVSGLPSGILQFLIPKETELQGTIPLIYWSCFTFSLIFTIGKRTLKCSSGDHLISTYSLSHLDYLITTPYPLLINFNNYSLESNSFSCM
jgi:hypothetical protein